MRANGKAARGQNGCIAAYDSATQRRRAIFEGDCAGYLTAVLGCDRGGEGY